jgi:exodeoxyribonuclease VII small subunit
MEKDNKLTYDEALQKAEAIIAQLEQSEAISMDAYKKAAAEATALLKYCKSEIEGMQKDLS